MLRPLFVGGGSLYAFARGNRPDPPEDDDALGDLLFRTYVRGSKNFQASYRLAWLGYGAQSFILGRALYEDMLVAHWIKRNPEKAPAQFARYERLTRAKLRAEFFRLKLRAYALRQPKVPRPELEALREEFEGRQHWTKLSMDGLKNAVRAEFPEEQNHRRLLEQVHGVIHRYSNLTVHHSYLSLEAAAPKMPNGRTIADVGASPILVPQALFIGFFSYAHLLSLYVAGENEIELAKIWHKHQGAFTKASEAAAD